MIGIKVENVELQLCDMGCPYFTYTDSKGFHYVCSRRIGVVLNKDTWTDDQKKKLIILDEVQISDDDRCFADCEYNDFYDVD